MKTPEDNPLMWNGPVGMIGANQLTSTLAATLEYGETPAAVVMTPLHQSIVRGAAAVLHTYAAAEELPGMAPEEDTHKDLPKPRELVRYFQENKANVASVVAAIPWLTDAVPVTRKGREPLKLTRKLNISKLTGTDEASQIEQLRVTVDEIIARRYDRNNTGALMIDAEFPDQVGTDSLPPGPLLWNMAIELVGNTRKNTLPEPALAEALASGFVASWESLPEVLRNTYPAELYDLYESISRARLANSSDITGLKRQIRTRYGDTLANRPIIDAEEQRIQKLYDQLGKVAVSKEILEHLNTQHMLYIDATSQPDEKVLRQKQLNRQIVIGALAIEQSSAITYQHTITQDVPTLLRQAEEAIEQKDTAAIADAIMALNEQRRVHEPGASDALHSVWGDAVEIILRLMIERQDEIKGGEVTVAEAAFISLLSPKKITRSEDRRNATFILQDNIDWAATHHFGKSPRVRDRQTEKRLYYTRDVLDESGRQLLRAGYVYNVMRRGMPYGSLDQRQLDLQARILADRTNRLDDIYSRTSDRSRQLIPPELDTLLGNIQKLAQKARGGRFGKWLSAARIKASNVMQPPAN
jgi:hypothetical protein